MALSIVEGLRARSAFQAGVSAAQSANQSRKFAQAQKRRNGTWAGGGYFWQRGFEMAKNGLYVGRGMEEAYGLAVEDFEHEEEKLRAAFEDSIESADSVDGRMGYDSPIGPELESSDDDSEIEDAGEDDTGEVSDEAMEDAGGEDDGYDGYEDAIGGDGDVPEPVGGEDWGGDDER